MISLFEYGLCFMFLWGTIYAYSIKKDATGRILGGKVAEPHTFPHQVYMDMSGYGIWQCSGSLISPNYILTSGSCTLYAEEAIIYFAITNIIEPDSSVITMRSTDILTHENYIEDEGQISNIGLVKLPEPIVLSEYIQLIPLPSRKDIANEHINETAIVAGWGYTEYDVISGPLLYTNIRIIPTSKCLDTFGSFYVQDDIICAVEDEGLPCADRGAPLIVDGVLVGLFAFTIQGCYSSYPVAFENVAYMLDWIEEHTELSFD